CSPRLKQQSSGKKREERCEDGGEKSRLRHPETAEWEPAAFQKNEGGETDQQSRNRGIGAFHRIRSRELKLRSPADLGHPDDFRPLALFLGIKLRRFRRTEVFNQGLSFFDVADDLRVLQAFAERGAEPLDDRRWRFCRRKESHPNFQVELGKT